MYQIAYFQKQLDNLTTPSFIKFKELYDKQQIYQPIIFCDNYSAESANIPIFHSSYINQHFYKQIILTDFDQIQYIENFKNKNFILLYNKLIHDPKDKQYFYIDLEDSLLSFLQENCHEYKTI